MRCVQPLVFVLIITDKFISTLVFIVRDPCTDEH